LRRLARFHPYHGIGAGDIGKFELVDARLGLLGRALFGVEQRRHELATADPLELRISVLDGTLLQHGRTLFRRHGVPGHRWIALTQYVRMGEDRADAAHLLVGEPMHTLQLLQQLFVLLVQRSLRNGSGGSAEQNAHHEDSHQRVAFFRVK